MKSFETYFSDALATAHLPARPLSSGECSSRDGRACTLCHARVLSYDDEVRIKNEALRAFWADLATGAALEPLVPAPLGRSYRTVTKRKAFHERSGFVLGLIEVGEHRALRGLDVVRCAIEPDVHAGIFHRARSLIESSPLLAEAVQYVILKGNYDEQFVIVNVRTSTPQLAQHLNAVSKELTHSFPSIAGVFIYEDTSGHTHYLGTKSQHQRPFFKKLFGKSTLFHRVGGKGFLYHPLSFSQVNASAIDTMVQTAKEFLACSSSDVLYDLYCGYGLFALSFAPSVQKAVGVEVVREAISSAEENARRQRIANVHFIQSDLAPASVQRIFSRYTSRAMVLLDPPRNGAAPGVIETIAVTKPARVLHLFCNADIIHDELARWNSMSYRVTRARPIDNFPGTNEVELFVLLEPA